MHKAASIIIALVVSITGCGDSESNAPSEPVASHDAKVLGHVDGRPIHAARFAAYLESKNFRTTSLEKLEAELARFAERDALAEAALATGLLDTTRVDVEVAEYRKQLIIGRYFEAFLATAVTDASVSEYYRSHQDEFSERRIKLAQVFLRVPQSASETRKTQARKKIDLARADLDAGTPFAEVAKKYSEDAKTVERAGELGWIREGAVDPNLSEQAFTLETGAVSAPFQTRFGWHIIKVQQGPETSSRPLTAVSGKIAHTLRARAKASEIDRLEKSADIKLRLGDWRPATAPLASP